MQERYEENFFRALENHYLRRLPIAHPLQVHLTEFRYFLELNAIDKAVCCTESFLQTRIGASSKPGFEPRAHVRNLAKIISTELSPLIVPYTERMHATIWSTNKPRSIDSLYTIEETYNIVSEFFYSRKATKQGVNLHNPRQWLPPYLFDTPKQESYTRQSIALIAEKLTEEKEQARNIIRFSGKKREFDENQKSSSKKVAQIIPFTQAKQSL